MSRLSKFVRRVTSKVRDTPALRSIATAGIVAASGGTALPVLMGSAAYGYKAASTSAFSPKALGAGLLFGGGTALVGNVLSGTATAGQLTTAKYLGAAAVASKFVPPNQVPALAEGFVSGNYLPYLSQLSQESKPDYSLIGGGSTYSSDSNMMPKQDSNLTFFQSKYGVYFLLTIVLFLLFFFMGKK